MFFCSENNRAKILLTKLIQSCEIIIIVGVHVIALSKVVPSKSIKETNKSVESILSRKQKQQESQEVSAEMMSKIAKYAPENG